MTEDTTTTEDQQPEEGVIEDDTPDDGVSSAEPIEEPAEDTFPRSYVEELRTENRRYRERAQDRDALAHRLHVTLVSATGRLADPTDLEFDQAHLEDDGLSLTEAIDELLKRKPHLASRKPRGNVGQGASTPGGGVDLAALLRHRAS